MTHVLQWFTKTEKGQVREVNEDAVLAYPDDAMLAQQPNLVPTGGRICIVADGMGGHQGGQQASTMAVTRIRDLYYSQKDVPADQAIATAIHQTSAEIVQLGNTQPELKGMGTTVVLALAEGDHAYIANVGDSRAYLLRDGTLTILSLDDRMVAQQVREGIMSEEQARSHHYRNVLLQSLGSPHDITPHIQYTQLQAEDRLLLCSDGLFDVVDDATITRILTDDPHQAVDQLIRSALERETTDNVTVAIGYYGPLHTQASTSSVTRQITSRLTNNPTLMFLIIAVAFLVFGLATFLAGFAVYSNFIAPSPTPLSPSPTTVAVNTPTPEQPAETVSAIEIPSDAIIPPTPSPETHSLTPTSTLAPYPTSTIRPVLPSARAWVNLPRLTIVQLNDATLMAGYVRQVYDTCRQRQQVQTPSFVVTRDGSRATEIDFLFKFQDHPDESVSLVPEQTHRSACLAYVEPVAVEIDVDGTRIRHEHQFIPGNIYHINYTDSPVAVFAPAPLPPEQAPASGPEIQAANACPNNPQAGNALVIFSSGPGLTYQTVDVLDEQGNAYRFDTATDEARCYEISTTVKQVQIIGIDKVPPNVIDVTLQAGNMYIVRGPPD